MKTVTWGATGTHATLKAAWDGTTFDDDVLFQQVGVSTETASISYKNFDGLSVIVRGNGDVVTYSAYPLFDITTTVVLSGKLYIEDLNFSGVSSTGLIKVNTSDDVSTTTSELHVRSNILSAGLVCTKNSKGGFRKIYYYQNLHYITNNTSSLQLIAAHPDNDINIEDNAFICSGTQTSEHIGAVLDQANLNRFRIKRMYVSGKASVMSNTYIATYPDIAEIYTSTNDTDVPVGNRSITLSTDNFVSITIGNEDYLVPKATSVLYTGASQTTNIPENVIGLNGITTTRHTVGCMSTPPQILTPTGVTITQTLSGVAITWTNTVQVGYEKTYIYYETANADSLFVTPKASTLSGVTTYTIPYSALVGNERWYIRLAHGA